MELGLCIAGDFLLHTGELVVRELATKMDRTEDRVLAAHAEIRRLHDVDLAGRCPGTIGTVLR